MTTLPVRELSPIQQAASDASLRWDVYERQQTNAALNLLDERLRRARSRAGEKGSGWFVDVATASLAHCAEALRSLGVDR